MKLKFQYGSNGPIGRQLAAWQNSLFPGYVSFRRLQFHHQNRLIISLINKGANTWIITQPPYSHNFCRSKTAINNRELLYLITKEISHCILPLRTQSACIWVGPSASCLPSTFICLLNQGSEGDGKCSTAAAFVASWAMPDGVRVLLLFLYFIKWSHTIGYWKLKYCISLWANLYQKGGRHSESEIYGRLERMGCTRMVSQTWRSCRHDVNGLFSSTTWRYVAVQELYSLITYCLLSIYTENMSSTVKANFCSL